MKILLGVYENNFESWAIFQCRHILSQSVHAWKIGSKKKGVQMDYIMLCRITFNYEYVLRYIIIYLYIYRVTKNFSTYRHLIYVKQTIIWQQQNWYEYLNNLKKLDLIECFKHVKTQPKVLRKDSFNISFKCFNPKNCQKVAF